MNCLRISPGTLRKPGAILRKCYAQDFWSMLGGKGSALGATLGALLIVLFHQFILALPLDQNYEWIIIGSAIIVAVVLDRVSANLGTRRLARAER